jgi:mono/diheme cytochrome c family protein
MSSFYGAAGAALTPDQVQALPPPAARAVDFAREVKPIFEANCTKCHARGQRKGGLSLERRGTALAFGDWGLVLHS